MTPNDADYAINLQAVLAANHAATQGEWLVRYGGGTREDLPRGLQGKDLGHHQIKLRETYQDVIHAVGPYVFMTEEDACAIALTHNAMPGIIRRLLELEDAVLALWDAHNSDALDCEMQEFYRKHDLIDLAGHIKAGRAGQK